MRKLLLYGLFISCLFGQNSPQSLPPLTGGGAPTGAAGGSLAGTYPNPTFSPAAITNTCVSASASTTAYTCTASQVIAACTLGMEILWTADVANSSTGPTLNAGCGAKNIVTNENSSPAVSLIAANAVNKLRYDGTSWRLPVIVSSPAGGSATSIAFAAQTDGSTVTWAIGGVMLANASLTFTAHGGSRTLNLTGLVNGGTYLLKLIQDGTGGENLTGGTGCTWKQLGGGGGTFTLTATAAAIDVLAFSYDGTNCLANLGKAYN